MFPPSNITTVRAYTPCKPGYNVNKIDIHLHTYTEDNIRFLKRIVRLKPGIHIAFSKIYDAGVIKNFIYTRLRDTVDNVDCGIAGYRKVISGKVAFSKFLQREQEAIYQAGINPTKSWGRGVCLWGQLFIDKEGKIEDLFMGYPNYLRSHVNLKFLDMCLE